MIRIEQVTWAEAEARLSQIRRQVFIIEQKVPEALEWDGEDPTAVHLLAYSDDLPVGTLRMLADGHLGRMAVLQDQRSKGIGQQLMRKMIELAQEQGLQRLVLAAQTHAVSFYTQFGYIADDRIFLDAGIPHQRMQLQLSRE